LDLYTCLIRAWEAFQHKDTWRQLQQRGMRQDFSWKKSALAYHNLYRSIFDLPPQEPSEIFGASEDSHPEFVNAP
jgi:starch synthase